MMRFLVEEEEEAVAAVKARGNEERSLYVKDKMEHNLETFP